MTTLQIIPQIVTQCHKLSYQVFQTFCCCCQPSQPYLEQQGMCMHAFETTADAATCVVRAATSIETKKARHLIKRSPCNGVRSSPGDDCRRVLGLWPWQSLSSRFQCLLCEECFG